MDEMSALLGAARAGKAGAFEELIAASRPELGRFCRFLVGPDEAEDVLQEAYLALWRALPSFRGECSARSWLFLIVRRSAQRLSERRGRAAPRRAAVMQPPPAPGARLELVELLATLDADRRSAFALTQLLGFSYAEAAAIAECPVGTIRSRVARAREELSARLLGEGVAPALGA
ncbi:MAG TPA: RNA polymerase sigma factor [Acidimicrobiales bacterium]|nr:RNA polymerase sigma factor [Acidimicrobiales bacterium]